MSARLGPSFNFQLVIPSPCFHPRLVHATALQPGAIAILQLLGDAVPVLRALTGLDDWPLHKARLAPLADIDHGICVRLSESVAQVMPHGGVRVVQRLLQKLRELGAEIAVDVDPALLYPEAADPIEAMMLLALSRAASPLAVDLLLQQPRLWCEHLESRGPLADDDRARSRRLNRLITPPRVVLAGAPNVGKSTLSNALLGRALSIALDQPGTTRDYTVGRIDLAGLVVEWHDTPGLRATDDEIERKAIEIARRLIDSADLLIAMRDPHSDWPVLPRQPDVRVINKIDLLSTADKAANEAGAADVLISAISQRGLAELVSLIRDRLVPAEDLATQRPWLFDDRL